MDSKENGQIEEIADDIDEIGEDTDAILRRIDDNVKRQNHILKELKTTKMGIMAVILLWIIDKVIMWIIIQMAR